MPNPGRISAGQGEEFEQANVSCGDASQSVQRFHEVRWERDGGSDCILSRRERSTPSPLAGARRARLGLGGGERIAGSTESLTTATPNPSPQGGEESHHSHLLARKECLECGNRFLGAHAFAEQMAFLID